MTDKLSAADLLDLVIEKAEGLRRVGVLELELDGCGLVLAPYSEPAAANAGDQAQHVGDPLDDPAMYPGLGGRVPGFKRLHTEDDDELEDES